MSPLRLACSIRLVRLFARLFLPTCCLIGLSSALLAQPLTVVPVRDAASSKSLDGLWQFKYIAGTDAGADAGFSNPAYDISAWKSIAVPSHWELQGFAEPKYGKLLEAGLGLYRLNFRVPDGWTAGGKRLFLRFEGVLYGFDAWVNGTKVGSWASSYNPATFDITAAVKPGTDNVLAVQVTTRSKGWEFDTNDCWALSGIYRSVTLFTTPETHFQDYTVRTTLGADGTAQLHLDVQADRGSETTPASVKGRLISPEGAVVQEFQIALGADAKGETTVKLEHPALWTAETPSLYRLDLELTAGRGTERISDRVGLRQITIEDGVLKLNGRPIKLHGADHHDLAPDVGRAMTEEQIRKDLMLMKAANMNFLRTSHYPPNPRLIELCDELGIYVMCEVPFGFGDEHLTDPSYQDILLTRARATLQRDKNRPSIIVWSVGNENPNTPLTFATGQEVKRLDPTRPICFPQVGSYFGRTFADLPDFVDIYAPHYPVAGTLRDYAQRLKRPIIVTEYAHALGLASDRIQEEWDIMQKNPRFAGGAVWMFQDQGILRTAAKPLEASASTHYVWTDPQHYYDTSDLDGTDGIVYSDRTPQTDYWEVRKVYSPVQITQQGGFGRTASRSVTLAIENRFDFRPLSGLKLLWDLKVNSSRVQQSGSLGLTAASHAQENVQINLSVPFDLYAVPKPNVSVDDVFTLETRVVDETGQQIYERNFRIDAGSMSSRPAQLAKALPTPATKPGVSEQGSEIVVTHSRFELRANRQTGAVSIRDDHGHVIAEGFYPHVGRKYTMAEELRAKPNPLSLWQGSFLKNPSDVQIETATVDTGVKLTVHGKFGRPGAADQSLDGEYSLLISDQGTIEVTYGFTPVKASGVMLEAGLSVVAPHASEFHWVGQGPYPAYPGKDVLDEFGVYHLNREDLNFQGNRRQVEAAVLTDLMGSGLALAGENLDVAVENNADGSVTLSQNAMISGRGNKGSNPEGPVNSATVKQISGKFTLLPLASSAAWPPLLTGWFGDPRQTTPVFHPFFQSYDQ